MLGRPGPSAKDKQLAEEDFSLVLSELYPDKYPDPMSWYTSRAGTNPKGESPEDAVAAIRDMLKFRRPGATLFLVVDEVSQYVLSNKDRVDRLRAFATALGSGLKGKAWLLALGQQKLDEEADDSFLVWAKDRFPPKLRVHLAADQHPRRRPQAAAPEAARRGGAAPRDVREAPGRPQALRLRLRGDHGRRSSSRSTRCSRGTSTCSSRSRPRSRTRSARAQGDDQAIRGLLQLLGELFRDRKLADMRGGLARDARPGLRGAAHRARLRRAGEHGAHPQPVRRRPDRPDSQGGEGVALLELIQETMPTDAKLVAQCLYDRVDRGSQVNAVTEALEELRRRNLLGYSEKQGYKIQSTAGEEWERERRDIGVPREEISELVQGVAQVPARHRRSARGSKGRPFPWAGVFSDGRRVEDAIIADPRDDATVRVDFRFLARDERTESAWVRKSAETALHDRLVWVCGDTDQVEEHARELQRSRAMVDEVPPAPRVARARAQAAPAAGGEPRRGP